MKPTCYYLLLFIAFAAIEADAQYEYNPYKTIGKKAKVCTLSNGKYKEWFDNDSIIKIGTVLFNRNTNKIVRFMDNDTAGMPPEISSTWLSPDPITKKYPGISPYVFSYNNPINVIDPDGKEGVVVSGQPGDHKNREHFLVNGLNRARMLNKKFKEEGKGETVTWLIYNGGGEGGYETETIEKYTKLAGKYGISVQVVSNSSEIVNYVNNKTGGDSRSKDQVSNFYYLGHATPGDLDVGFINHGWWNMLTNDKIEPSSFDKDAFKSSACIDIVGGCRTAIDGDVPGEKSVMEQFSEKVDEKSTIKGSNVRVYYPGGSVSDEQLVQPNKGKVIEMNGKKQ